MATVTLSLSKNFDDVSIAALVNGDTLAIDTAATLTINSDNRWSQQAAVPGSIAANSTTGGGVTIDGTTVWQIPFTSSTGNVPALGTVGVQNCTGGTSGATGEFLGVWATGSQTPTAAASAMPATGIVKFRSKVGTFQAETVTLISGCTVACSGAGQRSWINVVMRDVNNIITVRPIGSGLNMTGDWYNCGTLTGTNGESIQLPVADVIGAVFIEKSPGSAATVKDHTTLDMWLGLPSTLFNATYIATDVRGRCFLTSTTGLITFGGIAAGYGKPTTAGCHVYLGNIFMSGANSANYAVNSQGTASNTRACFAVTASVVGIDKVTFCGGWYCSYGSYKSLNLSNVTGVDYVCSINNSQGNTYASMLACGNWNNDAAALQATSVYLGTHTFTDVACTKLIGSAYRDNPFFCTSTNNLNFIRVEAVACCKQANIDSSFNFTMVDCICNLSITSCSGGKITNLGIYGRPLGSSNRVYPSSVAWATGGVFTYTVASHDYTVADGLNVKGYLPIGYDNGNPFTIASVTPTTITTSATALANPGAVTQNGWLGAERAGTAINLGASSNLVMDGVYFAYGTNAQFYYNILSGSGLCSNIRLRNFGTKAAPMDLNGLTQSFFSLYQSNSRVSRCYAINASAGGSPGVTGAVTALASGDINTVSDQGQGASGYLVGSIQLATDTQLRRIVGGGNRNFSGVGSIINNSTSVGCHWFEADDSATSLLLGVTGSMPTSTDYSAYQTNVVAGTPKYNGVQGFVLSSVGDSLQFTSLWIKGVTGFANIAPINSATNLGNHTIQYDLDKGTGFSGTLKTATAANLSAETGISSTGIRVKLVFTCSVASTANIILVYALIATSTDTDKNSNMYPLNEPLVTYTGGISGSDMSAFDASGNFLVNNYINPATYIYAPWNADAATTFRLRKSGYRFVETSATLTENGLSIPVAQTAWTQIPATNPGALSITVANHGASPVTWNGKQYSITITNNGGYTALQIANYINYNTAIAWPGLSSIQGTAWPEMIVENGSTLETARGTLQGSAGAALKGVRVVDGSGNAVSGFGRFQADDGTYYTAVTLTISPVVAGSDVVIITDGTTTELANANPSGTSYSYNYVYTPGTVIDIKIYKSGYLPFNINDYTLGSTSATLPASQVLDRNYS